MHKLEKDRAGTLLNLKGTAILMTSMFYQKELYESCILIHVSSKSVENGQVMNI